MLRTRLIKLTTVGHLLWKRPISRSRRGLVLLRSNVQPFNRLHPCMLDPTVRLIRTLIRLSRALPAFTIHTAVAQARKAFANAKTPRIKTWGPTMTGLAIVPILPYLFDHPVEHATNHAFDWIREKLVERNQAKRNTPSQEK